MFCFIVLHVKQRILYKKLVITFCAFRAVPHRVVHNRNDLARSRSLLNRPTHPHPPKVVRYFSCQFRSDYSARKFRRPHYHFSRFFYHDLKWKIRVSAQPTTYYSATYFRYLYGGQLDGVVPALRRSTPIDDTESAGSPDIGPDSGSDSALTAASGPTTSAGHRRKSGRNGQQNTQSRCA